MDGSARQASFSFQYTSSWFESFPPIEKRTNFKWRHPLEMLETQKDQSAMEWQVLSVILNSCFLAIDIKDDVMMCAVSTSTCHLIIFV